MKTVYLIRSTYLEEKGASEVYMGYGKIGENCPLVLVWTDLESSIHFSRNKDADIMAEMLVPDLLTTIVRYRYLEKGEEPPLPGAPPKNITKPPIPLPCLCQTMVPEIRSRKYKYAEIATITQKKGNRASSDYALGQSIAYGEILDAIEQLSKDELIPKVGDGG